MPRLKLELVQYRNYVLGRILEQEGIERGSGLVEGMNGMSIRSAVSPYWSGDILWIRGSRREEDDAVFVHWFSTAEKANDAISKIKALVAKINSSDCTSCREAIPIQIVQ